MNRTSAADKKMQPPIHGSAVHVLSYDELDAELWRFKYSSTRIFADSNVYPSFPVCSSLLQVVTVVVTLPT